MVRLVLVKSWGGDSAYGPECYMTLTEEQWNEVKRLQVNIGLCADEVRDAVDTRDAGALAHELEALEILVQRCKAEMSNGNDN